MTASDKALEIVPARQGKAAYVKAGEAITIINTHGTQVVDTWCFLANNLSEFMSMEHQRSVTQSVFPAIGVPLYSNYRRPLLTLEQDTSPGGTIRCSPLVISTAIRCLAVKIIIIIVQIIWLRRWQK